MFSESARCLIDIQLSVGYKGNVSLPERFSDRRTLWPMLKERVFDGLVMDATTAINNAHDAAAAAITAAAAKLVGLDGKAAQPRLPKKLSRNDFTDISPVDDWWKLVPAHDRKGLEAKHQDQLTMATKFIHKQQISLMA